MSATRDICIERLLYSQHGSLTRRESEDEDDQAGRIGKPAVIGIAVATTMIVLAAIVGLIYWLIRRRRKRKNGKVVRSARDYEGTWDESSGAHANDRLSKTPLMQDGDQTPMTNLQSAESRDNEESRPLAFPLRAHSNASVRSLPPSYDSATRSTNDAPDSPPPDADRYRPESNTTSSNGLRPLSLVEAYQHEDRNHPVQASSERQDRRSRLSIGAPNRERSRSVSRFHEDLDV